MNVVNNFIRLGEKYATKKSTGPRKKLSQRDEGKILQEARRRNKLNESQIKRKLDQLSFDGYNKVLKKSKTLR